MQRYRYAIDTVRSHLRSLWAVIGLQLVVILGLWIGWMRMPSVITVHVPPDLRSGAVLSLDDVPSPNVYLFTLYVFQQLNRWQDDGAEDYGKAVFRLAPYLTPRFRNELLDDMDTKGKKGELAQRVRSLQPIPGRGYDEQRVDIVGDDAWIVWLDLELNESVKGMPVKQTTIRYPIRVSRYPVDAAANPWGLALDGYAADGPVRLDESSGFIAASFSAYF
ncbi:MAG: TIGR03746 family integrating conjugative element protein [Woeseiaceae bacterium]